MSEIDPARTAESGDRSPGPRDRRRVVALSYVSDSTSSAPESLLNTTWISHDVWRHPRLLQDPALARRTRSIDR
jgi:hypothetical protein